MKIITKNINNFSDNEIRLVADMIQAGKIGVIPTDTIYGFSALAKDKKATLKINKIKKRASGKFLIILMKSFCMLRKHCYLSKKQYDYIKAEIANGKSLTVILKNKSDKLKHLVNDDDGLAVRIPQGSECLTKLLKYINEPIISTSLNLSGEPPVLDLKDMDKKIDTSGIDFIMDMGKIKKRKASRVVDIIDIQNIKILRK